MSKLFLVSVGLWKFCSEMNALSFHRERRTDRAVLLHRSFASGGRCDVMAGKCSLTCTAPGQVCPDSFALRRAEKRTLAEEE